MYLLNTRFFEQISVREQANLGTQQPVYFIFIYSGLKKGSWGKDVKTPTEPETKHFCCTDCYYIIIYSLEQI